MSEDVEETSLILYHSAISPCAQKVRLVLEEKSLAYESRLINIVEKENLEPWYLAINPQAEVPALIHAGQTLLESTLICVYLDRVFPAHAILPDDPVGAHRSLLIAKAIDEKLHPALGALAWSVALRRQFLDRGMDAAIASINQVQDPVRRARQLRILKHGFDAPDVTEAVAMYAKLLSRFDALLEGQQWLAGSQHGLADIALTPYVHALHQYGLHSVFLDHLQNIPAWFECVQGRASFARAVHSYIPQQRRTLMLQYGQDSLDSVAALIPPS
tara:strand:+ start:38773 stop:39591 length:819 start_codon:yes stop_codon:yes gene_type:complete